jgi:hypothetical protein
MLSGDCAVSFAYAILNLQTPKEGSGSGVGLALDAGDEVGRRSIQRVDKNARECGCVLQTVLGSGTKTGERLFGLCPAPPRPARQESDAVEMHIRNATEADLPFIVDVYNQSIPAAEPGLAADTAGR